MMIETMLRANGFPEAAEWMDQPHIHKELKTIADSARKQQSVGSARIKSKWQPPFRRSGTFVRLHSGRMHIRDLPAAIASTTLKHLP
jgi:hypothetical protein